MDAPWMLFCQAALLLVFAVASQAARDHLIPGTESLPFDVQSAGDNLVLVNQDKANFLCTKCLQISKQAEEVLSNPDTLTHAKQFLREQVCVKFEDDLQEKCEGLLDTYVPAVLATLQEFMAAEKMCKESGLCSDDRTYLIANKEPSSVLLTLASDTFGQLQEDVAYHLEDISGQIQKLFAHTCVVPRMCSKSSSVKADHCSLCQYVVIELKIKLRNPKTQEKLLEILLDSCKRIPNHVNECQSMVLEYVPLLLVNLETLLDPTAICAKIGACPPANKAFML